MLSPANQSQVRGYSWSQVRGYSLDLLRNKQLSPFWPLLMAGLMLTPCLNQTPRSSMLGTTLGKIKMVSGTSPYKLLLLNFSISQLLPSHQPIPQATIASSSEGRQFPWDRVGCISKRNCGENTILIQRWELMLEYQALQ